MAIEDILIHRVTVNGQTVEVYEVVDVTARVPFRDDDGRNRIRVDGNRLAYVVRGRGAGLIRINDSEGFSREVEPSRGNERKQFDFPVSRPETAGRTVQYPG